jgi:hypothetical protein
VPPPPPPGGAGLGAGGAVGMFVLDDGLNSSLSARPRLPLSLLRPPFLRPPFLFPAFPSLGPRSAVVLPASRSPSAPLFLTQPPPLSHFVPPSSRSHAPHSPSLLLAASLSSLPTSLRPSPHHPPTLPPSLPLPPPSPLTPPLPPASRPWGRRGGSPGRATASPALSSTWPSPSPPRPPSWATPRAPSPSTSPASATPRAPPPKGGRGRCWRGRPAAGRARPCRCGPDTPVETRIETRREGRALCLPSLPMNPLSQAFWPHFPTLPHSWRTPPASTAPSPSLYLSLFSCPSRAAVGF